MLHIATGDLLEINIFGDIRRYENVGQLPIRHEKFWNQVDVPVIESSVLLPRLLTRFYVAILPEELLIVSDRLTVAKDKVNELFQYLLMRPHCRENSQRALLKITDSDQLTRHSDRYDQCARPSVL